MTEELEAHLKKIGFEQYFKKLKNKIKDKKVIIYGAGMYFQYIKEHYDLGSLNIIGISDTKFSFEEEGKEYLGYKIVPKTKIKEYNPDIIIVATLNYLGIVEDFALNILKDTKIKVYPLMRIPFGEMFKNYFNL